MNIIEEEKKYILYSFSLPYLDFLLKHQISDHHEKAAGHYGDAIESIDLGGDGLEGAYLLEIQKCRNCGRSSDLAKEYGETHAAEVQEWWLQLRVYKLD